LKHHNDKLYVMNLIFLSSFETIRNIYKIIEIIAADKNDVNEIDKRSQQPWTVVICRAKSIDKISAVDRSERISITEKVAKSEQNIIWISYFQISKSYR